jgi:integrase
VPDSAPGLARPSHPANPAERRDAIAQAWQDEPGITDAALAERFGVSRRTIQRDTQALQERGIQRRRRRNSHRTQAHHAAIYRRFFAWLADEFGRPATRQDLSADVLARWIARRASAGGHGRREAIVGVAAAGMHRPAPTCPPRRPPELATRLHASRQQAPPSETISPAQYERLLLEPDLTTPLGLRDWAILRLLADVGLRPSEVCALKLGDIIWSGDGQVPVQLEVAWGQGRVVKLTPQAAAVLTGWLRVIRTGQLTGGAGGCQRRRHCSSRSGRRNPPGRQ